MTTSLFSADGLHLSPEGYQVMATGLAPAVREALADEAATAAAAAAAAAAVAAGTAAPRPA